MWVGKDENKNPTGSVKSQRRWGTKEESSRLEAEKRNVGGEG